MKFRSYQITQEQVRLLLFKECDWRGRKLLFDSSTIDRVPAGKDDKPSRQADDAPCVVEVANGFSYVYKGPAEDASVLGEMIFGAVAMNYRGVSFKIHIMEEPKRLMCTKVFCVPTSRRISRVDKKMSDINSSGDLRCSSKPLSVPTLRKEGVEIGFSLDRGDSGFCGDQSPYSSVGSTCDYFSMFDAWDSTHSHEDFTFHSPPGRKLSTSSNGSWQRRTFQNIATRFELSYPSSNLLSVPSAGSNITSNDSQIYSNSSTSGTSDSLSSCFTNLPQKKNKLGLALLITVSDSSEMDEVRRCVEHSTQLQALVCRLRLATLAAGSGHGFVSTLHRATVDTARWLSLLLRGPRAPASWLAAAAAPPRKAAPMADSLLTDLCQVLAAADTKHTNFFVSTLLTHVLTYHLGWVTTVSPYDTPMPPKQSNAESTTTYNALWAQLSDLCGSIGFPPRAARTIISGSTNPQLINRILVVLTYFVRSGEVRRSDYELQDLTLEEPKVINVNAPKTSGLKRTATVNKLGDINGNSLKLPLVNTQYSDSSVSTLAASDTSIKRCATLVSLGEKLTASSNVAMEPCDRPMTSQLKRNPTLMLSLKASSDSSLNSSTSEDPEEQNVIFVLGDDDKLVGLKNKSSGGKSVKRSSKVQVEPINLEPQEDKPKTEEVCSKGKCDQKTSNDSGSPSKCCGQTLQHSKPIKHSGFKFEFDKYPQIVTNYMKSKNLEILDRHYIGKPGNLKLDNYQFDPMIVPPIQEEKCDICYKCQQMESMLQTPTNASEMEYMNDMPRQLEPQYATVSVYEREETREMSPKTFVRKRKENTIVVNIKEKEDRRLSSLSEMSKTEMSRTEIRRSERVKEMEKEMRVKQVLEFPMPGVCPASREKGVCGEAGFDATLLGGVTDHYVPDLIVQGTIASPQSWEAELRRDLDLSTYLNKTQDSSVQAVAIIGDTSTWEVRVIGRDCGTSGMSSLVGSMLDALPAMWKAKVPAHQCLQFLEGKLRELCVLSKTLADMLLSTELCDIATLTKSLNIDVNDVPLLLAVASTHTPQVALRYGISYR